MYPQLTQENVSPMPDLSLNFFLITILLTELEMLGPLGVQDWNPNIADSVNPIPTTQGQNQPL